jgi:hypothetical protein
MESNEADHRRAAAIQLDIERKLIAVYGFCANPSLTAFQNAVKIRGETNACLYFSKPANLAFYNLTPDKRVPNIAKSVLGLNLKFIYLRPLAIIYIFLKTFFGAKGVTADDIHVEMEHRPKLYMKSKWTPELQMIPDKVHDRISNF